MDDNQGKEEEKLEALERNVEQDESHHELFSEKVRRIGAIHTQRALLANRLGRLKLEVLINQEEVDETARERVAELEKELSGISKDITDFSPGDIGELESFESSTKERLATLEEKIEGAEGDHAGQNPVI